MGKSNCCQVWWSEWSWASPGGRLEPTSRSCTSVPTCSPWPGGMSVYIHTDTKDFLMYLQRTAMCFSNLSSKKLRESLVPGMGYFFGVHWPVKSQSTPNFISYCQCSWFPSRLDDKTLMLKTAIYLSHRTWRNGVGGALQASFVLANFHSKVLSMLLGEKKCTLLGKAHKKHYTEQGGYI